MSEVEVMELDQNFDGALQSALLGLSAGAEDLSEITALQQRMLRRLTEAVDAERSFARVLTIGELGGQQSSRASFWMAIGAHAAAIAVVLFGLTTMPRSRRSIILKMQVDGPVVSTLSLPPLKVLRADKNGGGGGNHDIAPAALGRLPKIVRPQIMPVKAPPVLQAKLAVEPTLVMQNDLKLADNNMPNLGLPNSSLRGVSPGNGFGTGLGSGNGAGIGPGSGGNMGGGVMHIGGSVHAPMVIRQVDAEYSEEARKAKFSGNVEVYLWVDEQGNPSHVRVVRGAGLGLDEKAKEAVEQYKFKPAMQNGKPVKVDLYVDVGFQIF